MLVCALPAPADLPQPTYRQNTGSSRHERMCSGQVGSQQKHRLKTRGGHGRRPLSSLSVERESGSKNSLVLVLRRCFKGSKGHPWSARRDLAAFSASQGLDHKNFEDFGFRRSLLAEATQALFFAGLSFDKGPRRCSKVAGKCGGEHALERCICTTCM